MPQEPSRSSTPPPRRLATQEERQRVLTAYESGDDCLTAAKYNNLSRSAAYRLCKAGDPSPPARGGARASVVKLSTSTISAKPATKLITLKQIRKEPSTCNNEVNKMKRYHFAKKLVEHQGNGDYIVYYDETNYNLFCMRSQGRAAKGKRAVVKTPPSKGKNLQMQCAVAVEDGLVLHQLQRGSIRMDVNASFVKSIYDTVKNSSTYRVYFAGKSVVVVLDDAPAHNQTETWLVEELGENSDLVLLRLGPYSPMLNPIEGCFSVFKAKVKAYLAVNRQRMFVQGAFRSMTEARMTLLEDAANASIHCMHRHVVTSMALHCQRAMADALKMEDMQYGT